VAYPLVVVSLCVSPTEYFLRNWTACFEAGLNKLKVSALNRSCPVPTKPIALGKSFPHPRHEWDDASHLDLLVPLPRITVNYDVKNGIATQELFPT
jgi:hypothetical protein